MGKSERQDPESFQMLVLSDEVDQRIYNDHLKENFPGTNLVISCGDLPFYYLEYVIDMLNVPMFFVHGNHDPEVEYSAAGQKKQPWGAENLDGKVVRYRGLMLAGFEGSLRYSSGRHESTQFRMWLKVLRKVPNFWLNKLRFGRYLDVLVTHAPAWDVSDQPDKVHRGFKAFRWLLQTFRPRFHLHGHVHVLDRSQPSELIFEETQVINAYTYKRVTIEMEGEDD